LRATNSVTDSLLQVLSVQAVQERAGLVAAVREALHEQSSPTSSGWRCQPCYATAMGAAVPGSVWLLAIAVAAAGCDRSPGERGVAAGGMHSCAWMEGKVRCWGQNRQATLGVGSELEYVKRPKPLRGLADARQVVLGHDSGCALRTDGMVVCWGRNTQGQLGDGTMTRRAAPGPVKSLPKATAVAAGAVHTCALSADGTVRCWGSNNYGQLGDGSRERRLTPVAVAGLPGKVAQIACGAFHTCAVLADGQVACWGANGSQQIGRPEPSRAPKPALVAGLTEVKGLALGAGHTCAVVGGGEVRCWGDNSLGQLGQPRTGAPPQPVPQPVESLSDVVELQAGKGHTCARTKAGQLLCWGSNDRGQLGAGQAGPPAARPLRLKLTSVTAVAAGAYHTCALAKQQVHCWGHNGFGQLGDGSRNDRAAPTPTN